MNEAGGKRSVSQMYLQDTKFHVTIHHVFIDFNCRKRVEYPQVWLVLGHSGEASNFP